MTAILLPGWTCPCGRFNGAEKEWRTECSACGRRANASPAIRPSDVAAGRAECERPGLIATERDIPGQNRQFDQKARSLMPRFTPAEAEAIRDAGVIVEALCGGHRVHPGLEGCPVRTAWDALVTEARTQIEGGGAG